MRETAVSFSGFALLRTYHADSTVGGIIGRLQRKLAVAAPNVGFGGKADVSI